MLHLKTKRVMENLNDNQGKSLRQVADSGKIVFYGFIAIVLILTILKLAQ